MTIGIVESALDDLTMLKRIAHVTADDLLSRIDQLCQTLLDAPFVSYFEAVLRAKGYEGILFQVVFSRNKNEANSYQLTAVQSLEYVTLTGNSELELAKNVVGLPLTHDRIIDHQRAVYVAQLEYLRSLGYTKFRAEKYLAELDETGVLRDGKNS